VLISLAVLAGTGGEGETLSMKAETGLGVNLIFFVFEDGAILGVNFTEIFSLRVLDLLSVYRKS